MHIALDDDTSKGAEEEASPGYQIVLAPPPIRTALCKLCSIYSIEICSAFAHSAVRRSDLFSVWRK